MVNSPPNAQRRARLWRNAWGCGAWQLQVSGKVDSPSVRLNWTANLASFLSEVRCFTCKRSLFNFFFSSSNTPDKSWYGRICRDDYGLTGLTLTLTRA